MGNPRSDGYHGDGETPVHTVTLDAFRVSPTAVSNDDFAAFVGTTGYQTEAETFGWSFVFMAFVPDEMKDNAAPVSTPWWRQVFGADWRHPEGPQSTIDGRGNHPAIHISWNDAIAYCDWSGTRLLTEAEWEYAAKGGHDGNAFPWGNALEPDGDHRMNVFQGQFPITNTQADGFASTAPVDSYEPNGYGLYCVTGNVWEWTSDWFSPRTYEQGVAVNPTGPTQGQAKVMRGGSYLCHASYCNRYRVDSRSSNTPDSSTGNLGFRVAAR